MPAHVNLIRIDWHYQAADAALKASLPALDDRMTSLDHTYDTFLEQLREAATAHPSVVADALIEDGFRAYFLVRIRASRVEVARVDERPEDALAEPIELPLDEVVDDLPVAYPDLAALQKTAGAIDEGAFVAEVELDRYLVEPGRIRKLVVVTEPELVARLLREDYAAVPRAPRERDRKYEIGLYWPEEILQLLQAEALRLGGNLSAIAQEAFAHARYTIAQSERAVLEEALRSFGASTTKRKQAIYLPGEMLDAMERQATRLDSSVSFVAHCAVVLARKAITTRPKL
jgi:uncharacterized small protein (TIGR04563 family)